jgi:class 3 adenylate cyclase
MSRTPLSLAIMFADVSGSTRLYEMLGDKVALEKIEQCLGLLGSVTRRLGGETIKTIGDEIMCVFPTAAAAVQAAVAMQEELAALAAARKTPLRIRIGLHFGEVIREEGDVFGDAVNVAARMAGIALADQIITTRDTANALPPALRSNVRQLGGTLVKGKREEIGICEIIWQNEGEMTMIPGVLHNPQKIAQARLTLRHAGRELVLDERRPTAVIGRDSGNSLVVDDPLASRRHARVELRNGKFLLADQSTNGTYVVTAEGKSIYLHREELPLIGSGAFSLGHETALDSADAVRYSCD